MEQLKIQNLMMKFQCQLKKKINIFHKVLPHIMHSIFQVLLYHVQEERNFLRVAVHTMLLILYTVILKIIKIKMLMRILMHFWALNHQNHSKIKICSLMGRFLVIMALQLQLQQGQCQKGKKIQIARTHLMILSTNHRSQ